MEVIFKTIVGAIVNRIRGGGLTVYGKAHGWNEETLNKIDRYDKHFNDLVFALVFISSVVSLPVLFCAMWAGRALGWGRYIGGMIYKQINPHEKPEVEFIDNWIFKKTNYPVLRNTIALSLRGCIWSTCLSLGFCISTLNISYLLLIPVGLLMGITYLIAIEICGLITRREDGWPVGEIAFGAVLWGGAALIQNIVG